MKKIIREYLYKNMIMNKETLIKIIRTIDNINQYYTKGGTAKFKKHYPNILEFINKFTSDTQIYSSNKILEAKIKYLLKYNGDINNITINNKILIFDKKVKDFKIANINSAKKQWDLCRNELNNIVDYYDETTTRNLLKNNYLSYFGKSGNRRLLRDNKKLYLSLYYHTKEFNNLNKNQNKFTYRLHFFVNNINIRCEKHNTLKYWKLLNGNVIVVCAKCNSKYPSKEWYINKYGDEWSQHYTDRREYLSKLKTNGKEWYINKYGEIDGINLYRQDVEARIKNITTLKGNKYSKISQDLFWRIYEQLIDKTDMYFHALNKEYVIRIPEIYNHENVVMMVDFKYKNKIIEYNGNYWHNTKKDDVRYSILKEMGYEVLVVTSSEYNRNKKSQEIIDKCFKFLTC